MNFDPSSFGPLFRPPRPKSKSLKSDSTWTWYSQFCYLKCTEFCCKESVTDTDITMYTYLSAWAGFHKTISTLRNLKKDLRTAFVSTHNNEWYLCNGVFVGYSKWILCLRSRVVVNEICQWCSYSPYSSKFYWKLEEV